MVSTLWDKYKTVCPVPFTTLILEPDGSVGICRQKGSEFTVGHLNNSSIEEIWNNFFMQKWRKEFLENDINICKLEVNDMKCHLCAENRVLLEFIEPSVIQPFPPLKLTANLNGACNLRCQMCHIWQQPNNYYTDKNFWIPAQTHIFPFLKEIDMLSGEPFIQADTYRLIDTVSVVNPECMWSFTTNAHWKFSNKIKTYLDRINVKNFIISLDSLSDSTYAKIRKGGDLSLVLDTINQITSYFTVKNSDTKFKTQVWVNFLVQIDNWKEVPDFLTYCTTNNMHPFVTFLYEPNCFSLTSLSSKQKVEILNYWIDAIPNFSYSLLHRIIMPLYRTLPKIEQALLLSKLMP